MRSIFIGFLSLFSSLGGLNCHLQAPQGWMIIDRHLLAKEVQFLAKEPTKDRFPASINLAIEETTMTLEEYLAAVARLSKEPPHQNFRLCGEVKTQGGPMRICQVDLPWAAGQARILQAIMVREGVAYVITGTSSLEEFAKNYKNFYTAFQSFSLLP